MRILFFFRWAGARYGGIETHIREIAFRLVKKGHVVHLLTRAGKNVKALKDCEPGMNIWTVSKSWRESDFSYPASDIRTYVYTALFAVKALLKLITLKLKGVDYDVVSVHFFTEALLLRMFRWLIRWRYLFFLEGYTDLDAREAKYANLQLADSQTVINKCYAHYGYKPLLGLVGTDTDRYTPNGKTIRFTPDKKVVFTVSRLAPQKNLQTFVEAAKLVCEKDSGFLFLIGGEGSERPKLESLVKKYGLKDSVFFTGGISNEELPVYYRSADIFVTTEFPPDETLITVVEAMSSGVCVIGTSPTGGFEVIGQGGMIVPIHRPDKLAEKILEVAYNEKLRKEMVRLGLKRAKRYDWDRLAKIFEKACELTVILDSSKSMCTRISAKNAKMKTP